MNKSILLATVVGSLITNTVTADYTGLDYTAIDNGDGTWTARIFAEFSAPTDELHWVFGDSSDDLFITSTNGFYQHPAGGATSAGINPAWWYILPSMQLDSFVTIQGVDSSILNLGVDDIGIDWDDFELNGGDIFTDNGGWFAGADDPSVIAGADLRVMVGQFTMFGLDSSVSGSINLWGLTQQWDGTTLSYYERGQAFSFSLPTPSALALLGIAGVISPRRRR